MSEQVYEFKEQVDGTAKISFDREDQAESLRGVLRSHGIRNVTITGEEGHTVLTVAKVNVTALVMLAASEENFSVREYDAHHFESPSDVLQEDYVKSATGPDGGAGATFAPVGAAQGHAPRILSTINRP